MRSRPNLTRLIESDGSTKSGEKGKTKTIIYLDLPKGAKWLLKGLNSTSLRV